MTITRSGMTPRRVAEALAESNMGPIVKSESENGDDNENGNGGGRRNGNGGRRNCRNGNGRRNENNMNNNGNGDHDEISRTNFVIPKMVLEEEDQVERRNENNMNNNGNGDHDGNPGGAGLVAHECTYKEFLNCQPFNFKGTEGVVELARWFNKTESMFHVSNCPPKYQVKYALCTLQNGALTWWNSYKRIIRTEAAYALT
nr:putative reverse transcriptase domain-containing protein [Tanacetum cinerariifolium]